MTEQNNAELVAEYKAMAETVAKAKAEIHKSIYGQDEVVTNVLASMLTGGHALMVGAPGLAKTKLVNALGEVMGVTTSRIQFTPDLMPSDILGSEVLEQDETGKRYYRFIPGPIFSQLVLADEINRASPRTQSALLQAMQEGTVTIGNNTYPLPQPFFVLATQNPIEQEGTYPLPEAQRDRFRMQIDVDYPDEASELKIAAGARARSVRKSFEELNGGKAPPAGMTFVPSETSAQFNASAVKLQRVMSAEQLLRAQELLDLMPPNEAVVKQITSIVRSGRPGKPEATPEVNAHVTWAPGPRALEALMLCSEARALVRGDVAPSRDDLMSILEPVMKLRMALKWNSTKEDWTKVLDSMKAGPK